MTVLPVDDFLLEKGTVFDVRSPSEYSQGHIPGSINLPLFTNDERALVGTAYKRESKQAAISLGLALAGPKLATFAKIAFENAQNNRARIYCWRGGMRSGAMAWLVNFCGIETSTLKGGYKAFRKYILKQFETPYQFLVIGGMTGSGKTEILQTLQRLGEQTLDLEAFASHRGSAFGRLGIDTPQPTTEHFENTLGMALASLNPTLPVWIEDESRMIGTCHLPKPLFEQLCSAPLFFIDTPKEERIKRLLTHYGKHPKELLASAINRIGKHLGGLRKSEALHALEQGSFENAIALVLDYYDKTYSHALTKLNRHVIKVPGERLTNHEWALRLIHEKNIKIQD